MQLLAHGRLVISKFLQSSREKWFYTACVPFLLLVFGTAKYFNIPTYDIVADPAELCQREPYLGFLSIAGLLAWGGGITSCFFTLSLLKSQQRISRHWQKFIFCSGLFSVLLCLDDWLQLHETLPAAMLNIENVGKSLEARLELVVYGLYFLLLILYITTFKLFIYQTRYLFLVAAVVFFALSNLVDLWVPEVMPFHFPLEEGSKFWGIVSWSSYLWYCCKDIAKDSVALVPSEEIHYQNH